MPFVQFMVGCAISVGLFEASDKYDLDFLFYFGFTTLMMSLIGLVGAYN